jgi:hypothetical protein
VTPDLVPSAHTRDRIARFDGEGLPVVSVYLAVTGGPDAQRAIRTWLARTGPLGRGTLAIFSCSGAGMFEVVRLPRAVRDRVMVDATPWIGPMLAVLDEYLRCCALAVDRESAHLWEPYLDEARP